MFLSGQSLYPDSRRGAALIVTLALVVLLTLLVTAFLKLVRYDRQATFVYSQTVKAEEVARAGYESVLAGLLREIRAGSERVVVDERVDYFPTAPATTVVQRTAAAANPVKISQRNTPMYANSEEDGVPEWFDTTTYPAPNQAAAVNSVTDRSANGRVMSVARWDRPKLWRKINGTDPFPAPDWVYLTRSGVKAVTDAVAAGASAPDNLEYVVGRYAFVVYDVGGLIDLNAAGAPAVSFPTLRRERKGSLAFADLTALGFTPAQVENLVAWRNARTSATPEEFEAFLRDPSHQFSQVPEGSSTPPFDQRLINRQDLLDFQARGGPGGGEAFPASALPFLTLFNFERNVPSWSPGNQMMYDGEMTAGNPASANFDPDYDYYDYEGTKDDADSINRDLSRIRVPEAGGFTRIDGNEAMPGDELVRRFPLSRLAWIGTNGPTAGGTAAQVRAAFGLNWDSRPFDDSLEIGQMWVYVSPDGTASSNTSVPIKTLEQVRSLRREPDFFELLKAVILEGSLGVSSGQRTMVDTRDVDRFTDRQIIQIGANIVDQYDSNSYPTLIRYPATGSGAFNMPVVAGVENIPYLQNVIFQTYEPPATPVPQLPYVVREEDEVALYHAPQVWNPHGNAANADTSLRMRVLVRKGLGNIYNYDRPPRLQHTIPVDYAGDYDSATQTSNHAIEFQNGPQWGEPRALRPGNSDNQNSSLNAVSSAMNLNVIFSGRGRLDKPFWTSNTTTRTVGTNHSLDFNGEPVSFELQFLDAAGRWRTCQMLADFEVPRQSSNSATMRSGRSKANVRIDPRGMRLGLHEVSTPPGVTTGLQDLTQRRGSTGRGDGVQWGLPVGLKKSAVLPADLGLYKSDYKFENLFWRQLGTDSNPDNDLKSRDWTRGQDSAFTATWTENSAGLPGMRARSDSRYTDRDRVLRPADGYLVSGNTNLINPMQTNGTVFRPVVLNRPFQSVAELGHVHRDMPWKSLDFWSEWSADAGLLDVFSVADDGAVRGGVFHPARAPREVWLALLQGGTWDVLSGTNLPPAETSAGAWNAMVDELVRLTGAEPPLTRAGLASLMTAAVTAQNSPSPISNNWWRKGSLESLIRSTVDPAQTRTWNLMVDVVAQSGRIIPNGSLKDFVVEGERRMWWHLSIDRRTGEIIHEQWEPVYE